MRRRHFLTVTASATALGIAGCVQEPGDRENGTNANPETSSQDGPGSQPGGTGDSGTPTDEQGSLTGDDGSTQGWGSNSGGRMDGVDYSFSTQGPNREQTQDHPDVDFDPDAGAVVVDGTIRASDACKRASLDSIEYDESAGTLAIAIVTGNTGPCEDGTGAGAQVIQGIDYEGTFEFDGDLPSEVTVSHDGQDVTSATHESSSATVVPPTTDE